MAFWSVILEDWSAGLQAGWEIGGVHPSNDLDEVERRRHAEDVVHTNG